MPSRHEHRISSQDGLGEEGRTTNGIKIEQGQPGLPHARASERVYSVRLGGSGVLMSTRHFLGRGMLRVYGNLRLCVRRYWGRRLACVYVVVRWRDVVARYMHGVGPSGRDDLGAVTLVVGRSDGRHRVGRGRDIRMRRGRGGELRGIRWCGVRIYRRPSRRSLRGNCGGGRRRRGCRARTKGRDGGGNVVRAGFRVRERSRGRSWESIVSWVGTWTLEIPPNHGLEFLECAGLDVKLPLKVGAHLTLHLVDLPKGKHALTNDTPGLVRVSIIADNLGSNHKCRDEETMTGGTAGSDKSRLESLQQIESSKGHRGREPRAMESVGNEVGKRRRGSR